MNNNTIEIINILIKKVLEDNKPIFNENDIIQELLSMGYKITDIDQAMEFIFNDQSEKKEIQNEKIQDSNSYNRILTVSEKIYIPVKIQGLIRRLIYLNVLTANESETLIARTVQNYSHHRSFKTDDIWELLEDIISDETILAIIAEKIPEFNNLFGKDFKHIS